MKAAALFENGFTIHFTLPVSIKKFNIYRLCALEMNKSLSSSAVIVGLFLNVQ